MTKNNKIKGIKCPIYNMYSKQQNFDNITKKVEN